jgi:3-methyladenine DNA glycosylase AlkD
MAAYMKHHFVFLGVGAPARRAGVRTALAGFGPPDEVTVHAVCRALWALEEREYQLVACDYLGKYVGRCEPRSTLPLVEELITTKSWWDTVDDLCRNGGGALVRRDPSLRTEMDRWLRSGDMWLVRSAILHQERWGDGTDFAWLSAACTRYAEQPEFFIRKAIGWSLRTYAHKSVEHADAVRALLDSAPFSGLTRREALKRVKY